MVDLSFLTLSNIILWMGAWSLIGLAVMLEDKLQAVGQHTRISERILHEVALLGGFPGIVIGAKVFHHKTSKPSFWPPVGASIILWTVVLAYLALNGLIRTAV